MPSSSIRLKIVVLAAVLAAAVTATSQAAAPSVVVGPHGKVAALGYGRWLAISWQRFFSDRPGASACQSQRVSGETVALLLGGYSGKPEHHTCDVARGEPIYVNGLSAECSTVEKPPFHGSTPRQLRSCARRLMSGATALSATIDGHRVIGYHALISASPIFTFRLPKHNVLGATQRSGRSAAYGEGLLLEGLAPGNHTVHVTGKVSAPKFKDDVTYRLHIAG
jgi:hypothetical protein